MSNFWGAVQSCLGFQTTFLGLSLGFLNSIYCHSSRNASIGVIPAKVEIHFQFGQLFFKYLFLKIFDGFLPARELRRIAGRVFFLPLIPAASKLFLHADECLHTLAGIEAAHIAVDFQITEIQMRQ